MWKRENEPDSQPSKNRSSDRPAPSARPRTEIRGSGGKAVIGPSISIQGDITGEEDLEIQGRVEGKIELRQHQVSIGESGRLKADVFARTLRVEGHVNGNLHGEEQIMVTQTGKVEGNLTAPRVTLEDGCRFKGSIDMEPRKGARGSGGSPGGSSPGSGGSASGSGSSGGGGSSSGGSGGSGSGPSGGSGGGSGGGPGKPDKKG